MTKKPTSHDRTEPSPGKPAQRELERGRVEAARSWRPRVTAAAPVAATRVVRGVATPTDPPPKASVPASAAAPVPVTAVAAVDAVPVAVAPVAAAAVLPSSKGCAYTTPSIGTGPSCGTGQTMPSMAATALPTAAPPHTTGTAPLTAAARRTAGAPSTAAASDDA